MRLLAAALGILLVSPMSGSDVERALSIARSRDADRQQFHRRYSSDLTGPSVSHIEVITEFRRLVIIADEHVLRGDWMFTRGLRAAEDAIKPFSGTVTIKAEVRLSPLNTYIQSPPYTLAIDDQPIETQLAPQFSVPFKGPKKKDLSSLIGASLIGVALDATVPAARLGQTVRVLGVMLDGKNVDHVSYDFAKLD
jgi:hypothetical protein